jgi:hypothetical protein
MSKPCSIEHIFDFAGGLSRLTKKGEKRALDWVSQLVEPGLTLNDLTNGMSERRARRWSLGLASLFSRYYI